MAIKDQWKTIKNNWLLILIAIVIILFLLGGFPSNVIDSLPSRESSSGSRVGGGGIGYGSYAESSPMPAPMMRESAPRSISAGNSDVSQNDRKVVTSTNLNTQVEQGQFLLAAQQLKSILTSSNSLLLQEDVRRYGEDNKAYTRGTYTIKVEISKLETVIAALKEIGTVQSFSQSKEDITEPYKNLEIEITVEKERLARYQKILDEAKLVEDKITLNDKIFDQERQIKYLEDSLKNADKLVVYGTIYIEIVEKQPAFADLNWISGSELLVGFVNNVAGVITMVVTLLPYVVVGILIWLAIRWVRRRMSTTKR